MKHLFIASAALLAMVSANAAGTYMMAPMDADPGVVDPDSTGFTFTDVKILPTTPVKDQNKSGTCWSFSGTSVLEEEVLRQGGPELDLSEMYCVRNCYIDKAKKYIMTDGKINFAQGGGFADVLYSAANYGVVPEEVYAGLEYGEKKHSHYEMADVLTSYLDAVLRNGNKTLSDAWLKGYIAVLDSYLGAVPETFTYNGKTYTPQSFAKAMGINADDFINITSYT
ncbi:MAG: hypothetical protein K2J24_10200, partial [Muribaculaceae bacterium]|nr:hypothetical protein [Muribaculaceae bacterium]